MDNLGNILSSVMNDENLKKQIKETVINQKGDYSASLEKVISLLSSNFNTENEANIISTQENTESRDTKSTNNVVEKTNMLSFFNSMSRSVSKNSELLLALRPYLNKERSNLIDSIIKLSQITNTLNLL